MLAEDGGASLATEVELLFSDEREGTLRVGGESFPARLLDLPTKVEAWKTLDDVNLVKSADVGQIVVVGAPGATLPAETVCVNGVTAVMRCARGEPSGDKTHPAGTQGRPTHSLSEATGI